MSLDGDPRAPADPGEMQRLRRESLESLTEDLLGDAGTFSESVRAEIAYRVAKAQIDAARYMKWSVIAIAITSGLTALAAFPGWLLPNPLIH